MNRFFEYVKENTTGVSILGFAAVAIIGITLLAGCTLSDLVKVNVPTAVREVTNTKTNQVSLSQAPYIRTRYVNEITANLVEFDDNIEQASAFRDFAASLLNTGLSTGEGALAGVPGGAFLFTILGGLGGLFLKKPGTDALVQQEKKDSFNAGQQKAVALLRNTSAS